MASDRFCLPSNFIFRYLEKVTMRLWLTHSFVIKFMKENLASLKLFVFNISDILSLEAQLNYESENLKILKLWNVNLFICNFLKHFNSIIVKFWNAKIWKCKIFLMLVLFNNRVQDEWVGGKLLTRSDTHQSVHTSRESFQQSRNLKHLQCTCINYSIILLSELEFVCQQNVCANIYDY